MFNSTFFVSVMCSVGLDAAVRTGAFVIFSSRFVKSFHFFSALSEAAILIFLAWFVDRLQKAFHVDVIGQCTDAMMTPWLA